MNGAKHRSMGVNLFIRYHSNPILTTSDLLYPANSLFNTAAAVVEGETVLLTRVEDMRGMSHLVVFRSRDGITNWRADEKPTFLPMPDKFPEEQWGVEDPRAVYLEELGTFAITYTAYSRRGPQVSLALTKDFRSFERKGSIIPPEDKNAALFSRRIGDHWAILHRPVAAGQDANIWISFSSDLKHWGDHQQVLECRRGAWWDSHRIGTCPPPLETPIGWLLLYHGVRNTVAGAIYRLGLALLDLNDPQKVLHRSDEWIFGPQARYEQVGDVGNVVFPCGWVHDEVTGNLHLYYGAADTVIALATARMDEVLEYIQNCPAPVK